MQCSCPCSLKASSKLASVRHPGTNILALFLHARENGAVSNKLIRSRQQASSNSKQIAQLRERGQLSRPEHVGRQVQAGHMYTTYSYCWSRRPAPCGDTAHDWQQPRGCFILQCATTSPLMYCMVVAHTEFSTLRYVWWQCDSVVARTCAFMQLTWRWWS